MKQGVLWLVGIVAICSLGSLGFLEYRRMPKPAVAEPRVDESAAASRALAEMQQQLMLVQQKTVALEARLAQSSAPAVKLDRRSETAVAPKPEPSDPQEEHQLTADVMNRYERRFAQDGPTSDWAREIEGSLKSAIAELDPSAAAQVTAIECRSNMCKLTTEHDSVVAAATFMDDMETRPGFRGSKFVRIRTEPGREAYEFFVEPRSEASSPIIR